MTMNFYRNQQMGYRVIPVSSSNEVNNITVDFNGMPTYFHNQSANEIYVKRFDMQTGLTTTQKFVKSDNTGATESEVKPEFDMELYNAKLHAINERLEGLEEKLGGKR